MLQRPAIIYSVRGNQREREGPDCINSSGVLEFLCVRLESVCVGKYTHDCEKLLCMCNVLEGQMTNSQLLGSS